MYLLHCGQSGEKILGVSLHQIEGKFYQKKYIMRSKVYMKLSLIDKFVFRRCASFRISRVLPVKFVVKYDHVSFSEQDICFSRRKF